MDVTFQQRNQRIKMMYNDKKKKWKNTSDLIYINQEKGLNQSREKTLNINKAIIKKKKNSEENSKYRHTASKLTTWVTKFFMVSYYLFIISIHYIFFFIFSLFLSYSLFIIFVTLSLSLSFYSYYFC